MRSVEIITLKAMLEIAIQDCIIDLSDLEETCRGASLLNKKNDSDNVPY